MLHSRVENTLHSLARSLRLHCLLSLLIGVVVCAIGASWVRGW